MKPQIYNATTKFHGKIRLQELSRSRNVQEPTGSPTGSPAGDPERDSAGVLEKDPDKMFKVIIFSPEARLRTLFLVEQSIEKLILGDCEVTGAGCQTIADIVRVNDTIVELDLFQNTKSSKKYKITIDESAEEVEKAKTTCNNIVMHYHDEVTHPDEVHEERVLQLLCW